MLGRVILPLSRQLAKYVNTEPTICQKIYMPQEEVEDTKVRFKCQIQHLTADTTLDVYVLISVATSLHLAFRYGLPLDPSVCVHPSWLVTCDEQD